MDDELADDLLVDEFASDELPAEELIADTALDGELGGSLEPPLPQPVATNEIRIMAADAEDRK